MKKNLNTVLLSVFVVITFYAGALLGSLLLKLIYNTFQIENIILKKNITLIAAFIFPIIFSLLIIKYIEKRPLTSAGCYNKNFTGKYLLGLVFGFIVYTCLIKLLEVTGNVTLSSTTTTKSLLALLPTVILFLPGVMIQSASEEILFRGWFMSSLGARYKPIIALVIPAALFSIMHIVNPGYNLMTFILATIGGLFFGIYVYRTNNIWGACGFHAAWNWTQSHVYAYTFLGSSPSPDPTLFSYIAKEQNIFIGGSFGPESGIAVSIIMLLSILILILFTKNSKQRMF